MLVTDPILLTSDSRFTYQISYNRIINCIFVMLSVGQRQSISVQWSFLRFFSLDRVTVENHHTEKQASFPIPQGTAYYLYMWQNIWVSFIFDPVRKVVGLTMAPAASRPSYRNVWLQFCLIISLIINNDSHHPMLHTIHHQMPVKCQQVHIISIWRTLRRLCTVNMPNHRWGKGSTNFGFDGEGNRSRKGFGD